MFTQNDSLNKFILQLARGVALYLKKIKKDLTWFFEEISHYIFCFLIPLYGGLKLSVLLILASFNRHPKPPWLSVLIFLKQNLVCIFLFSKPMLLFSYRGRMKTKDIDLSSTINQVENLLKNDKTLSPSTAALFKLLVATLTILSNQITALLNQKNLNSKNSSKPPSKDSNRPKKTRKDKGEKREKKKPGGQKGHKGVCLTLKDQPDKIEEILIDKRTLPKGQYTVNRKASPHFQLFFLC